MKIRTTEPHHDWDLLRNPPEFSLVLGGPLFQLFRRAHLTDDALMMVRQRIIVIALFAIWVATGVIGTILSGIGFMGVMALIARVVAHYPLSEILSLLGFILVCYVAILAMFAVHMVILLLIGQNPLHYLREVWGVLTFAFISRSSAASPASQRRGDLLCNDSADRTRPASTSGIAAARSQIFTLKSTQPSSRPAAT